MAIKNKTLMGKVADTFSMSVEPKGKATTSLSKPQNAKTVGVTRGRNYATIELSQIMADPEQPRTEFDSNEIERLAASLNSETGQIQAIVVRWLPEHSKYMVVTGERRFRAAQHAKLSTLECKIAGEGVAEQDLRKTQLVENLLREDLKPLEEAHAIKAYKDSNSLTGKQAAKALGISESRVSRSLKLLTLPKEVQQQIEDGAVSRTVAYEISKLNNNDVQQRLASTASETGLTKRTVSKAVKQRKGKAKTVALSKALKFSCRHGIEISIKVPIERNYNHVREAIDDLVEDVDARLNSNIGL